MSGATNGGPAFPVNTRSDGDLDSGAFGHQAGPSLWQFAGLTKRELFAAMAMQGLLSGEYRDARPEQYLYVANHAVHHADVLLAELAEAKP